MLYGKVDSEDDSARVAAQRETYEETGIWIPQYALQYLRNDEDFDCDMFIYKTRKVPQQTEPEKSGPWYFYDWVVFGKKARLLLTTPSLSKYWEEIIRQGSL